MKPCIVCKIEKDLKEFYKHPETADGYLGKCKECAKRQAKANRSPEKDRLRYYSSPRRRLYTTFKEMVKRCSDPNNIRYNSYGARGIRVLRKSFDEFYNDMIDSYLDHGGRFGFDRKRTQIDRINNNGSYCKENCRWVTAKENANNKQRNKK